MIYLHNNNNIIFVSTSPSQSLCGGSPLVGRAFWRKVTYAHTHSHTYTAHTHTHVHASVHIIYMLHMIFMYKWWWDCVRTIIIYVSNVAWYVLYVVYAGEIKWERPAGRKLFTLCSRSYFDPAGNIYIYVWCVWLYYITCVPILLLLSILYYMHIRVTQSDRIHTSRRRNDNIIITMSGA